MRDTLDGKLDLSSFLIDAHGFVPVPVIITEPALGGFGGLLAPIFITPKKVEGHGENIAPDITAVFGMYTVNGSYGAGAMRRGSFPKIGIKYRIGLMYANLNLNYYRTLPVVGEKTFEFNFNSLPVLLSVSRKILLKDVYLGLQYTFARTKVKPLFKENLPPSITSKELDSAISTISIFTEWDRRDNIFTPDDGFIIRIDYGINDNWTGSDYSFQKLNIPLNIFFPINSKWISGFRAELSQAYNSPPFYLLPSINMRGIPAARYQGNATLVLETEQRFDLNLRWSVIGFAGYGKAILENQSFKEGTDVYSIGTGFRYLVARAFKLRAGIDIAFGPDSFGWYIVFGHNWNR